MNIHGSSFQKDSILCVEHSQPWSFMRKVLLQFSTKDFHSYAYILAVCSGKCNPPPLPFEPCRCIRVEKPLARKSIYLQFYHRSLRTLTDDQVSREVLSQKGFPWEAFPRNVIPLEVFNWNTAVASGGIPIKDSSHYQHLLPRQSLVMRAIRYYGIEGICLENIPESECRSVCIKLEPNYVGICRSDMYVSSDPGQNV